MYSLEEKKELVIGEYRKSYDLDIAMMKCDLTTEEKKLMLNDTSFMFRISYEDALIREKIIQPMINNLTSADEKTAQKAATDLGKILWKDKFNNKDDGNNKALVPDVVILTGKKPKEIE